MPFPNMHHRHLVEECNIRAAHGYFPRIKVDLRQAKGQFWLLTKICSASQDVCSSRRRPELVIRYRGWCIILHSINCRYVYNRRQCIWTHACKKVVAAMEHVVQELTVYARCVKRSTFSNEHVSQNNCI